MFDYSYDGVMRSLEDSLERLGLDRVDILYAHDLDVFTHGSTAARDARVTEFMRGGYRALATLRETGVIKAFGAGVNEWQVCEALANAATSISFCSPAATRCSSRTRSRASCRSVRRAASGL